MKIKRKTFVGGLLATLCACTALTFGAVFSSSRTDANAMTAGYSVTVDELLFDNYQSATDGKIFNANNLNKLYNAILGTNNTSTYNDVAALTKDQNNNNITVAGSSMNNGNLVVKLGGLDWNVVYLSTVDQSTGDGSATNGDIILTLWVAGTAANSNVDNEEFARYNNYYSSYNSNPAALTYIPNMYGTSKVRAVWLNNGGLYSYSSSSTEDAADSSNLTSATATQSESNKFAKFTMSTLGGSDNQLYDYIVAPSNVHWQEVERFGDYVTGGLKYTYSSGKKTISNYAAFPNDAYGSVTGFKSGFDYSGKTEYGVWKNDKIWLPSATEVGSGNGTNGVWKCTNAQRTNVVSGHQNLRTGENDDSNRPVLLTNTGGFCDDSGPTRSAVRPALHLNLTAAEGAKAIPINTPTNIEFTYDGTEYTDLASIISRVEAGKQKTPADANGDFNSNGKINWFDSTLHALSGNTAGDANDTIYTTGSAIEYKVEYKQVGKTSYSTLTDFKVKDAGEYKITCSFEPNGFYKWRNLNTNTYDSDATKTFTLTVKQCEVKYKWANIGLDTSWKTTFAQTFTPATGTSAAPWVYLNYTLPVTAENTASGGSGGTTSNEKLPYVLLTFTGTQSQFADYKISNVDNVRSTTTKGTNYPKHADTYTVSFTDKNATTSNYKLVADTGESATRQYIIERLKVDVPTAPTELTYNGADQSFANVPKFDSKFMTYGQMAADGVTYLENATPVQSDGITPKMTASVATSTGKLTLTAKDADKYDMYYRLLTEANTSSVQEVRDYMWTDATSADPAPIRKVTYEIKAKTLEFTFSSSSTGWSIKNDDETNKLTYSYTAGKGPVAGEEPVLELYYYLNSDGETNAVKHSDSAEILFKDLKDVKNTHATGKYTIVIKLADWDDTTNTVNKNYVLNSELLDGLTGSALDAAKATYQKEVTITAGEASIDDIDILYNTAKKEADGLAAVAIPSDGLTYEYDSLSEQATEYKFELDFSNIDYLTYADTISWKYADGETTATKAGKLTVTVKIKVKDDEAANHVLPDAFDVTQSNKFKSYKNNGDGTATLTFEIEIKKHEITVESSDIPLQYQREGGKVEKYDPKNPPEFNGKPITISLPHESLYPHGIKEITFDETNPKKTQAGKYTIGATITLDDNHCLANGGSTVHVEIPWEISKEVIKFVWSKPVYFDEYFNDSSVAHLQVMLLSGLTEAQEGAIKYVFYKTVDGAPDTTPLSEAELKALCTNDRFTDPNELWLYVKAELTEEGAKKYVLEDDATKNPKRFKLGGQMTLIELKVDGDKLKGYEYGGALDLSKVFTLINTETGDPWDSSYYEIRVLKDGVDIGEISEFNPATNDAGKYVIKVNIKPEYADSYTLDKSNVVDFEIHRKEIAVPTVGNILFSGEYINLADYLGGSYAEYKDIISLSGDYKDLRNVSQSGYKARLTLTDPNYKWAIPTTAEPASLKLFAAKLYDNALEVLDDSTAELKWNITPLVVDATEMWTKGKNGATLNLPENINKLITGETLSVGYKYYDDADQYLETPELKGGRSFRVEAVFGGIDAESGNV
ncbi:MAG: hypothetical protein K2N17_06965, partial [Clostridia bacterium]|nr:hypothetical protein [Clostridia bacterium]